jgi:hypothetical protein
MGNHLLICFGEVTHSTSWRRGSTFSGNLSSMLESSGTPANHRTDMVPLLHISKAQHRMQQFHKHMAWTLLVTATTKEMTMSSMKIRIHHRRIVCCCLSINLMPNHLAHHLSHQFDTSLWILARTRRVFVAPTFNPELRSGPCKNQVAMVSSS